MAFLRWSVTVAQIFAPLMLCRSTEGQAGGPRPYVVEQIAPLGWFALGSGNGMRVWVTRCPPGAQEGDDVTAAVKVADAPLRANVWEQALEFFGS